jgi:hypothetical protein
MRPNRFPRAAFKTTPADLGASQGWECLVKIRPFFAAHVSRDLPRSIAS